MTTLNDLMNREPTPELPSPENRRILRMAFNVTQTQLAASLNVSRQTIHSWERGTKEPRGENLAQYAAILFAWQATQDKARKGRKGK